MNELRGLSLPELEELYAARHAVAVPQGCFTGTHLGWLDSRGAQHPLLRPVVDLMFYRTPFGVDFDAQRWFFIRDKLKLGRFDADVGPSRWRDTETVRLTYERSRLPWPIRRLLYDEVKPLSDELCLGLGGINADRGRGEFFFFALHLNR
ncbi:MAG: hypothetical protein JRI68_02595 [Deltaproteobacteria bacterium]|nr:hypothetical protein [Deltaproteobacteria bacterium]